MDRENKPITHTPIMNEPRALFVGCLDPKTTEADLSAYFRQFDQRVTVKLIIDFNTKLFKQCAIVTCSNQASCDWILELDHFLMGRKLRVELADDGKKGKKVGATFPIQVSGIEPTVDLDELVETFSEFSGLIKARFVQGIHPKQKKVAIIMFDNFDSFSKILNESHIRVGERNCRVTEYLTKQRALQGSPAPLSRSEVLDITHSSLSSNNNLMPLAQSSETGMPQNMKGLLFKPQLLDFGTTPLIADRINTTRTKINCKSSPFNFDQEAASLPEAKLSQSTYLYPVEVESDNLFKIFCHPSSEEPQVYNMEGISNKGVKLSESGASKSTNTTLQG